MKSPRRESLSTPGGGAMSSPRTTRSGSRLPTRSGGRSLASPSVTGGSAKGKRRGGRRAKPLRAAGGRVGKSAKKTIRPTDAAAAAAAAGQPLTQSGSIGQPTSPPSALRSGKRRKRRKSFTPRKRRQQQQQLQQAAAADTGEESSPEDAPHNLVRVVLEVAESFEPVVKNGKTVPSPPQRAPVRVRLALPPDATPDAEAAAGRAGSRKRSASGEAEDGAKRQRSDTRNKARGSPSRPMRAAAASAHASIIALSASPSLRIEEEGEEKTKEQQGEGGKLTAAAPPAEEAVSGASPPKPEPGSACAAGAASRPPPDPAAAAEAAARSAAAAAAALAAADPVMQLAGQVKAVLGVAGARHCTLKQLLKCGVLDGQLVEVRNRAGAVTLTGRMAPGGMVACNCAACKGGLVSCSSFEAHSGSTAHRPAEYVYLKSIGLCLKEFCAAVGSDEVDIHADHCAICLDYGDLLCCDGCPKTFHVACVGLQEAPDDDWLCPDCRTSAEVAKARLKGPRQRTGGPGRPRAPAAGGGGPDSPAVPRRVHMAAPRGQAHLSRNLGGAARKGQGGTHNAKGNGSRNRLLFTREPGALQDGTRLAYVMHGEVLLEGTAKIGASEADPSGVLCDCCNRIISCSNFEAHAGYAARRAPYDNIFTVDGVSLRKLARQLPSNGVEPPSARSAGDASDHSAGDGGGAAAGGGLEEISQRCSHVLEQLDTVIGGCVLCNAADFERSGFGPRTILICDQCEREYHVGCLAKHGREVLERLPEGDWFCEEGCSRAHATLTKHVARGPVEVGSEGHTFQVLRGRDGTHTTTWSLKAVHEALQESFDPIMDVLSDVDLMPLMIYCQEYKEWDYSGCYTMLLRHEGRPVAAAIMRVFGRSMAELPLIATRLNARRQGHCRVLLDAYEALLVEAGVQRLVLPAAHETVDTWQGGFGFEPMPEQHLATAKTELRLLIFPGTQVLVKYLGGFTEQTAAPLSMHPPLQQAEGEAAAVGGEGGGQPGRGEARGAEEGQATAGPAAEPAGPADLPCGGDGQAEPAGGKQAVAGAATAVAHAGPRTPSGADEVAESGAAAPAGAPGAAAAAAGSGRAGGGGGEASSDDSQPLLLSARRAKRRVLGETNEGGTAVTGRSPAALSPGGGGVGGRGKKDSSSPAARHQNGRRGGGSGSKGARHSTRCNGDAEASGRAGSARAQRLS